MDSKEIKKYLDEYSLGETSEGETATLAYLEPDLVEMIVNEFEGLEAEKKVEIDFDGNLKAMISIKDGKVNVLKAVNGYGDAIDINYVTVK